MNVLMYRKSGEPETVKVPDALAKLPIQSVLVHQVTVAEAANARAAHAHTKTRAEVTGGGKKPWRQKGTGRARQSSSRSPVWVGGGITFGPKPNRNFSKDTSRTMRNRAFAMALSAKLQADAVMLLENLEVAEPKSKAFIQLLDRLPAKGRRTLLILPEMHSQLVLAARNLADLEIQLTASVPVRSLLIADRIVTDRAGFDALVARATGTAPKQATTKSADTDVKE